MGEFAVSKPMPSLPLKIWGDANNELFKKSYYSKFNGNQCIKNIYIHLKKTKTNYSILQN